MGWGSSNLVSILLKAPMELFGFCVYPEVVIKLLGVVVVGLGSSSLAFILLSVPIELQEFFMYPKGVIARRLLC